MAVIWTQSLEWEASLSLPALWGACKCSEQGRESSWPVGFSVGRAVVST